MAQATHLYFDHPQEPDPEERGYYWAPRFTPVRKVFGFMPDDLFANVDFYRSGKPFTREELCKKPGNCVDLEKKENIKGKLHSVPLKCGELRIALELSVSSRLPLLSSLFSLLSSLFSLLSSLLFS